MKRGFFIVLLLASLALRGADIVHLTFENNFTISPLQITDVSGSGNFAQIPTDTPITFAGNYANGSRTNGRVGSWSFVQRSYGTNEYAQIIIANGGNPNLYPGYFIMTYAVVTNFVGSTLSNMPNGTVAFWISLPQTELQNPSMTVVCSGSTANTDAWGITSFFNESDQNLSFMIFGSPDYLSCKFPSLSINTWWHCAATWGANVVKLYTNGVQCSTGTMNGRSSLKATFGAGGSKRGIYLMCYPHDNNMEVNPGGPNNGWLGSGAMLDEFLIRDTTATAAEIYGLANVYQTFGTSGGATITGNGGLQ